MNRFDRITSILIQLQSGRVVKAQDLANRFGISLRTVYRDIRSLEEAGVPLYGEAGVGYSLVDGYRLPPVMFTPDEARAFITAEKLMEKFTDTVLQENFTSALYKVKAVLRTDEKDLVQNLDGQIMVKQHKRNNTPPPNILDILLKAIASKKAVEIVYKAFGREESSKRLIEPIGIFHENEHWHTIAYCHLRNDYRQFRIDRIEHARMTETGQREHDTTLSEYYKEREEYRASFTLQKAVIRVHKSVAAFLQERRHFFGFVSEEVRGDYIDMTFLSQSLEYGLARWFMMFADYGEVLEPQALKDQVRLLSEKISEKIKNSETC